MKSRLFDTFHMSHKGSFFPSVAGLLATAITGILLTIPIHSARAQAKAGLPPDCIKYMSYYQEDYKMKDYDRALPNWRKALEACPPSSSQNLYIHGTSLYTRLISSTKDAKAKESLVDTVLMLQDRRMEYFPAKRKSILNNKGMYLVNYRSSDSEYLYRELMPIASEIRSEASESILVNLMQASVKLYRKGALKADDVLNTYSLVSAAFDGMVAKDQKDRDRIDKASTTAGSIFAESNVASCADLIAIYSPKMSSSPDDASVASTVLRLLNSVEGCQGNDLYMKAATTLHQKDPSAKTAYALSRMYSSKADGIQKAISYLEEAVTLAEAGSIEQERMSIELAQMAYKEGLRSKAYEFAKKVAAMGNGYSGKAYLLLGNLWASAPTTGEVDRYARYWVAADYYRKAQGADESLKGEADAQLASVSRYYPEAAEMFMYDLKAGQGYDISCGGMSAHTTVRTKN